jgi:acetoin:2,6-dichlorophenolindophenol oxidoreductase subunit alpha
MEAVAAGFGAAMQPDDYVFATYRGHAHTLAKGVPRWARCWPSCWVARTACSGKGGSMHLTSVEHNMMGSYAIIGAHLCIANGAAWSAQMPGTDQVAVCFFGDGTTNIGAFHEAINFAAVWKLPVIFVCENNLYMEYTPIDLVAAVENPAADRAPAYGSRVDHVDGNDADAVYMVATDVIARARRGEGPSLVEAKTYRHGGHSRADPGKYRPGRGGGAWADRDPIPMYHQRMLRLGVPEG